MSRCHIIKRGIPRLNTGEKIKAFGLKNYDSISEFAKAMEMKFSNLHQYLGPKSKREPGAVILKKLKKLGCDINWLLSEDADEPGGKKTISTYKDEMILKLEREKKALLKENMHLRNSIHNEIVRLSKVVEGRDELRKKAK